MRYTKQEVKKIQQILLDIEDGFGGRGDGWKCRYSADNECSKRHRDDECESCTFSLATTERLIEIVRIMKKIARRTLKETS